MRQQHFVPIALACIAASLLTVASCSKKVTKLSVEQPVVAQKPVERPPLTDSSTFNQAKLEGEMAEQAKQALQPIFFDFNKSTIKPEGEARLTSIGRFMNDHPVLKILVAGNCDERGSSEYNIGLGQHRAQSAKDFLVNYGIAANRIEVTSYGKERLAIVGCTDEACHAKNRRDEFSVLENGEKPLTRAQ